MIDSLNWTCLIFGILFLVGGILFFVGQIHSRVKAWQNMPEEEKATVRIKPLCHNIGIVIMLCGVVFLASGIWSAFKDNAFAWCMIGWMVACAADLVYIERGKRYKVNPNPTPAPKKR